MKCLKWIAIAALSVSSINGFAVDIPAETIMDKYIGAGYDGDINGSKYRYDIDKMVVSRVGTILNVNIFTSFYNNIGDNDIELGDLFMAADKDLNNSGTSPWNPDGALPNTGDRYSKTDTNTGTNWNYVYDLGSSRNNKSGTGDLRTGFSNNNLIVSSDEHRNARYNQAVRSGNDGTTITSSDWSVGGRSYKIGNVGYGKVSFSFDVANTALATANQIAFRWAMTCANDIIEGVASFAPPKDTIAVPEPQTFVLMLLAMFGLIYRRKITH
ncbi:MULTISPECIES: PEP-CTERM sorting domain-containing protein [unclassified Colwellia]|uniref:PEP-CTERM sorting domain-containing protein n=1 Tax=unclassified Colwellia TaxID=196834 RepID=UPI0015F3E31E|nr:MULTISPECIES: PEP-CTERM sorting domain-containing protein [unclassified Colwellia]MBA6352330.1 PEP-CTERM sorting domain-containing protein [Colwellia sp. BRX9-1]MBA6355998.1 PEP-CTERM sorting domain-containing protein [Colwellia sp. BRX8-3]MBA6359660.1 PEP-CTERM sorting domain-containing protein [Colwellia sp. BRX8-6]MBA6366247.1 PEP-CTERM sorting domain-containing protein [Colwellia sp. BRX8-5]MBA6374661.1 PEP-CTERM sorting domain-containing protein [Colwellia sp. BRX8-2]